MKTKLLFCKTNFCFIHKKLCKLRANNCSRPNTDKPNRISVFVPASQLNEFKPRSMVINRKVLWEGERRWRN